MSCRAITFDFNGTLSDDESILYDIYAALFGEHGRPLTQEAYLAQLAGLSDPEIVHRWLGYRDDAEEVVSQRVDRYREAVADGATILPATRAAVRLAAARVPVAIVSGAALAEIRPVVAAAGLEEVFTTVVGADGVANGKPHPEGYLLALEHLGGLVPGLRPGEVTAFEDTEAGVAAAKAAGLRCVALAGTLPRARLARADEVVETIDEALLARVLDAA